MAKNTAVSWDDESNEADNAFVSWSEIGDFVLGTLVGVKETPSTLPDRKGEIQKIYSVKVRECSYHVLDDKKKVVPEAIEPDPGSVISVGGRAMIDSRMAQVKLGQVFGLKYTEEIPSKTKGYNPTKMIKVYVPKDAHGKPEMDEEYLQEKEIAEF